MKTLLVTSALALTVSFAHTQQFKHYGEPHSPCSVGSFYGHDSYSLKDKFLHRLSSAPRHHGCGSTLANLYQIQQSALSSPKVSLLGKVQYGSGKSWLGCSAKHDIESWVMNSGITHNPNTLIVVMGYADRSGCNSANYRLSGNRASYVKNHIKEMGWKFGLNLKTASVAMGEEVTLINHGMKHNRIAEVWAIEIPQKVNQYLNVVEHQVVAPQVITAPLQAPRQLVNPQPQPIAPPTPSIEAPRPQPIEPAPTQEKAAAPQAISPLQGLVNFLQQNVTLSNDADREELAKKIEALNGLASN